MSLEEHCESNKNCAGGAFDTQNSDFKCKEAITLHICDRCGQNFQNKTAVLSHIKWKHENPDSNRMCSMCQKVFPRRFNRDIHQKKCNKKFQEIKNNTACFFCDFLGLNRKQVHTHYMLQHNVNIPKKTLNFKTLEEFKTWKQTFEKDTKSRFVKATGTRQRGGINMMKYICHRDGNFQPKGKGIRRMKRIGSNKINCYCPANIIVSETDQNVKVVYIDTHIGHELDLCYLTMSESERAGIAQKLSMKIPFQQILDDIRDSIVDGELERIHLATRRDLWNIAKSYNLNHETILHKNNYSSVEDWVSYMQKSSNLVRFYKPQGEISKQFPQLEEEDFFLVIMNDTQKEMLQKFGNDCVCIDGTHDLNACDFQLFTVMVLNDMTQGFPCSFLFSNRTDIEAMEIFFKTIKDSLHNTVIHPKSFLSDMDDKFFNTWSAIIGPIQNRLFCSWHVDRAWRKNLGKIKNKEKQAVVYKKIKILMYEMDLNTFSVMVHNLLEELQLDTDCVEFLEYFETYVRKCTSWAYCHRKQCGINANMNLENLHRVLKHIYYGEKKVKRMDEAIITLMKFIRDKLFDRIVALNKREISKKIASIRKVHKKSLGFKNTIIDLGDSWNVCATSCDDIYRVEAATTNCSCNLRCEECKSCIHSYTCNCIDFSVKWNMCTHIHLVCMFLKNNISVVKNLIDSNAPSEVIKYEIDNLMNDDVSDDDSNDEEKSAVLGVMSKDKQQHSFDKRKQDMMNKVLEVCKTIESEEQLEAVLKQVAPLESIVNALSKKNVLSPKTSKEPANKILKRK